MYNVIRKESLQNSRLIRQQLHYIATAKWIAMDITADARAIVHHLHHDTFPWGPRELLICSRFINILE